MATTGQSEQITGGEIRTDKLGRFYCEPLGCWLSMVACAARYRMGKRGDKQMRESPCGARCNVGRSVARHKKLPASGFRMTVLQAPNAIASRDKNWGWAKCLQCGKRFKKGSGNHLWFCHRRCAKRFYRPYKKLRPAEDGSLFDDILSGLNGGLVEDILSGLEPAGVKQ